MSGLDTQEQSRLCTLGYQEINMTHVVERYITDLKKDIYKFIYVQAIHCKGKEVSGVKNSIDHYTEFLKWRN